MAWAAFSNSASRSSLYFYMAYTSTMVFVTEYVFVAAVDTIDPVIFFAVERTFVNFFVSLLFSSAAASLNKSSSSTSPLASYRAGCTFSIFCTYSSKLISFSSSNIASVWLSNLSSTSTSSSEASERSSSQPLLFPMSWHVPSALVEIWCCFYDYWSELLISSYLVTFPLQNYRACPGSTSLNNFCFPLLLLDIRFCCFFATFAAYFIIALRVAIRSRASSKHSPLFAPPPAAASLYASWKSCSIARSRNEYLAPKQLNFVASSPSSASLFRSARAQRDSRWDSFYIAWSSNLFSWFYIALYLYSWLIIDSCSV